MPAAVSREARTRELISRRQALLEQTAAVPSPAHPAAPEIRRIRRELDDVNTQLFEIHRGLAMSYAGKFRIGATPEGFADVQAAAEEGLFEAITSFDPAKGPFGPWADRVVRRRVQRQVRHMDHSTMTESEFDERPRVLAALERLGGHPVDASRAVSRVATELGVSPHRVRAILHPATVVSLDATFTDTGRVSVDWSDQAEAPRGRGTTPGVGLDHLTLLEPLEVFVLARRFGLDGAPSGTCAQIGQMIGVSRETIRRIEIRAVPRLESCVRNRGFPSDLTDSEWEMVRHRLDPPGRRGAPAKRGRRSITNAVLYRTATDCPWRGLPEQFGPWNAVWQQYRRWDSTGVWQQVMQLLQRTRQSI